MTEPAKWTNVHIVIYVYPTVWLMQAKFAVSVISTNCSIRVNFKTLAHNYINYGTKYCKLLCYLVIAVDLQMSVSQISCGVETHSWKYLMRLKT